MRGKKNQKQEKVKLSQGTSGNFLLNGEAQTGGTVMSTGPGGEPHQEALPGAGQHMEQYHS